MVKKYKDMDAQLQNTTFEYIFIWFKASSDEYNGSDEQRNGGNG